MRIDQITITRFLAAISIVVYHYGYHVFPFDHETVAYIFRKGSIGVSYFFILSGFVMIIAYGSKKEISLGRYYKNRFARIYPVYFLAIAVLIGFYLVQSLPIDKEGLILNIFMLQSWFPSKALSINTPGWSLCVEFLFYLIFPFLYNSLYSKHGYIKFILPVLLIWVTDQVFFHIMLSSDLYEGFPSKFHNFLFFFPVLHLDEFLIGNLAGLFFMDKLKQVRLNCDWLIITIVVIIIALFKFDIGLNYRNGLMAILFVPLIIAMSVNNGIITKLSTMNFAVFLGEISYGVYILQKPVYKWMQGLFSKLDIQNNMLLFYVSLTVLIFVSSLSYIYIETPLRNKIRKLKLSEKFQMKYILNPIRSKR